MRSSLRFGRFFGIEVGAHASWLIIVVLVTLSLTAHFSASEPTWAPATRWTAALLTAFLFFASVVIHELAHSLVAQRYGIPVREITLFLFGGVSQIESEARRPAQEFWIALVGPLSSVALAGAFGAVTLLVGPDNLVGAVASWLARMNILLAIFNMLPAFPLDGGRVLRGTIWWKTGDQRRATRIAAAAGRALALIMILGGVWMFFGNRGGFGALWIAFIGWFLLDAARASEAQVEMRHALRGVTAADLMTTDWPEVPADLPIERFVGDHLLRTGRRYFVVADGDRLLGLVTPKDLQRFERERWPELTVNDVMRPFAALRWVDAGTGADRVLDLMAREEVNQLPIMAQGRLAGIVSREQLMRLLSNRLEFAA